MSTDWDFAAECYLKDCEAEGIEPDWGDDFHNFWMDIEAPDDESSH
jgi:hypothetical protein